MAIYNGINVEIVLYRITSSICGYRGPLWLTLPLNIFIIILNDTPYSQLAYQTYDSLLTDLVDWASALIS